MSDVQATNTQVVCPVCGSARVIPIKWGRREPSEYAAAERGEIALGGCFFFENMPRWHCKNCGQGFGSIFEPDYGWLVDIETSPELIQRLVAEQFPQWAGLPVTPVSSPGTSYQHYRMGADLAVRAPREGDDDEQLLKEWQWLPRLAPALPLEVPTPLALGEPTDEYPCPWVVCRWIAGVNATVAETGASTQAATDLARFILALRQIVASDGPIYGEHNFGRGAPLATRDEEVRAALASLAKLNARLDEAALAACAAEWDAALAAPVWDGPPTWIHGDLHPDNLIVDSDQPGQLRGVIDFGGLGVGDPACDLLPAWALFSGEARVAFRAALDVDEASWARGRGWALSMALIALPYYLYTNPAMVALARHMIAAILTNS